MKKIFTLLMLVVFAFSLAAPSLAAKKVTRKVTKKVTKKVAKKGTVKKVTVKKVKKTTRRVPYKGPKPVFPKYKGAAPAATAEPIPADKPIEVKPATAPKPAKSGLFVEGGLAGGSAAFEIGYVQKMSGNLYVSGAAGYAIGNKFGIVILDLGRAIYQMDTMFVGAGLNYAMYSALVADIPGLSGKIPSQNMFGVELLGGMRLNKDMVAKVGWSSALGLRAAVGYEF